MKYFVIFISIVVLALSFWNNGRYTKNKIAEKRAEQQKDSIYLVQYEKLFHSIHINTQIIDSLRCSQGYMDSIDLNNKNIYCRRLIIL